MVYITPPPSVSNDGTQVVHGTKVVHRSTRTPSDLDDCSASKTLSHPSPKAFGCSVGLAILAANFGRFPETRSSRQVSTTFGTKLKVKGSKR